MLTKEQIDAMVYKSQLASGVTNTDAKVLAAEVERLKDAIRQHRDQRGDNRCWMDDYDLYAVLGEPIPDSACKLDEPFTMLGNCLRFVRSRHEFGRPYLSPQQEIEKLNLLLVRKNEALAVFADPTMWEHVRFSDEVLIYEWQGDNENYVWTNCCVRRVSTPR